MSKMVGCRPAGRLGAILLAAMLLGACGADATASPAATPSPSANPDEALVADVAALWSNPYDAAEVAALYAPDAAFYDNSANETSKGLEAIQAKVEKYAGWGFKVTNTSAPIRQGNFVAVFQKAGAPEPGGPILFVVELEDGKILNQWVYGAGTSPEASRPAAEADEALVADLAAVMSTPYDAAKVAALYAPNAVFHDMVANETSTGLEEIRTKVKEYAGMNFRVVGTSAPIRQDNFVAQFIKFGAPDATYPGLGVYEVKDGKVLNQWVYPAP